jgi:hypothetical protein
MRAGWRSTYALRFTMCFSGSKVFLTQLHENALAATPAPTVTLDTSDEPLAVVIDESISGPWQLG